MADLKRSVWVVEEGEYSDYRVVGVFSSEANARVAATAIGADASVAEWELDPGVADLRNGHQPFCVLMLRDGTVERTSPRDVIAANISGHVWLWKRTATPRYAGKDVPDALNATVWAKDSAHAIKIANEQRVQIIASGKWPEMGHEKMWNSDIGPNDQPTKPSAQNDHFIGRTGSGKTQKRDRAIGKSA